MKKKHIILLLLPILLAFLPSSGLHAQVPTVSFTSSFREMVWLTVSRHVLLSGEQVAFQAAVFEKGTRQPSELSKNIRVELIDSLGNRLTRMNLKLVNSQVSGSIPLSPELKSGWYYVRAYTHWMRNFPETEFAVAAIKVINPADLNTVKITETYTATAPTATKPGAISISFNESGLKIRSACQAGYELPGPVRSGKPVFLKAMVSLSEPGINSGLDMSFGDLATPEPSKILFLPETRSGILSGRVINKSTGKGIPNTGIALALTATNTFDAIKTNADGLFYFNLEASSRPAEYILSFIAEPDSTWAIEVTPDFDDRPFKPENKALTLNAEEKKYLQKLNTNLQLANLYKVPSNPEPARAESVIRKNPFYYPADRTIHTDNYIELANVGEVVYEVVPDVLVNREGGKARISVYSNQSFARDYETLTLIDGIPLTSQQELLSLPPGRIRTIEVKNRVYIHGNYVFSSVVNFISRNGDFAGLKLPAQSVAGTFLPPVAGQPVGVPDNQGASSMPLLDPVLLWNVSLTEPEGRINFNLNDLYGDFTIRIFGFDQDGKWVFGEKSFQINSPVK